MTEITQHSLQSQVIQEEVSIDERNVNSILEEEDITEATSSNLNRTPSPPRDKHEKLHQNGGSDSEEDVTEEAVQRFSFCKPTTGMDSLSTDSAENAIEETDAATTTSNRDQEQDGHSHILANVHEHADPEQASSDSHLIGSTDTVNSATMSTAPTTAANTAASTDSNVNSNSNSNPTNSNPTNSNPTNSNPTNSNSNHSNSSSNHSNSSSNHSNSNIAYTTQNSPPSIRGRSASSASPTTLNGSLLPRSQRVWEMDRQAPECRRCHRRFNFLIRRHHCRRCGQIVCDKCSSNRIRLPVEELIEDPIVSPSQYPLLASQSQRVCDTCYREPIRRSSESHQRRGHRSTRPMGFGSQMRRTDSNQSLMIDCPVCGTTFLGMQKNEQEEHLQRCLNVGSPPVQSPRYIVYQLSQDSTQIGDECPICFEEFEQGDKISRMICLCSYHQQCLGSWLQKGKGCPVHYDFLQI
ncbi:FYVE zinc finger-domain-containing protein [Parasitella parasitica]|nr:FYVE zinc finger-domain-containing protein [Parasitella parasitica]